MTTAPSSSVTTTKTNITPITVRITAGTLIDFTIHGMTMDIMIRSTTVQDSLYHWALAVVFIMTPSSMGTMIPICTDIIHDMPDSAITDTDSLATTAMDTVDMDSDTVGMAMVDMDMDILHVCT